MPNRKNKKNPAKRNKRKQKPPGSLPQGMPRGMGRPTLVLKAHALIANSVSNVNLKQINIVPTLSIFGPDVL